MRAILAGALLAVSVLTAVRAQAPAPPVPAPPDPAVAAFVAAGDEPALEAVFARHASLADQAVRTAILNEASRLWRSADFAGADRVYRSLLWLSARIAEPRLRASALIGRSSVAGQTGNLDAAGAYLREAIGISESLGDVAGTQPALNNLGIVLRLLGDLDGALASYERSLALAEQAGRADAVSRTLNNIGVVQFYRGNSRLAHDYFTRSLALKKDDGGAGSQDMANSLLNLGGLYEEQGDYQQALHYYERALAIWERVTGPGLSSTLSNLGHLQAVMKRPAVALEYYNRALALAVASNERAKIATIYYNLANLSFDAGKLDDAESLHRRSLALREDNGDRLGTVESLTDVGYVVNGRGQPADALPFAERAVALAGESRLLNQLWKAQTLLGLIQRDLKRIDQAVQSYEAALATIEQIRRQSAGAERARQLYFRDRMEPYYSLAAIHVEAGRQAEAFEVVERARARGLLDLLAGGRPVVRSLTADEQARERRLAETLVSLGAQIRAEAGRRTPNRDRLRELEAGLARARVERDVFTSEIYSAHPDLQFGRGDAPIVSLKDTAALVGPRTAIVEFVVEANRAWAYVLRLREREPVITAVRLPGVGADFRQQAVAFADQVATRNLGFGKLASSLYASLIGAIEPHLSGVTHLVLVPDGPLWQVPFQALRSPRGTFLIEERAVSYAPSVSALHALAARRTVRSAAAPYLVAFGDPAYAPGDVRVRQVRLPEAAREVRAIGDLYGADRSVVLTDREATEPRLRELAGRASVLHVATHGVLDDKSPMYSYLALAPAGAGAEGADGRLEAWELMAMNLRANLAVLSACATARGEIGEGEGVIGLTWSLFAAGAATAAVSLWEVDSASTTGQMIEFHRQMSKGAGPAEAMRQASMAHIKTAQFRHPFYWAAFSIVGVP